ncbi:MAG: hypothetical protein E4H09_00460, partial [Spirochaetales bacterium]
MNTLEFNSGNVGITVVEDERRMGVLTAEQVAGQILAAHGDGRQPVLWLMAAPSAFAFYQGFIELCRTTPQLAAIVRDIPIYQFDDYPVGRTDPRFPVTFRALLEEQLYRPLAQACGPLSGLHPMELTGEKSDAPVAARYADEIAQLLADPGHCVIQ